MEPEIHVQIPAKVVASLQNGNIIRLSGQRLGSLSCIMSVEHIACHLQKK